MPAGVAVTRLTGTGEIENTEMILALVSSGLPQLPTGCVNCPLGSSLPPLAYSLAGGGKWIVRDILVSGEGKGSP